MHQKIFAKLYFVVGWPKISTNHLFNDNICCSLFDWYCGLHTFVAKIYKQYTRCVIQLGGGGGGRPGIACTCGTLCFKSPLRLTKLKAIKDLVLDIYIGRSTNLNKGL